MGAAVTTVRIDCFKNRQYDLGVVHVESVIGEVRGIQYNRRRGTQGHPDQHKSKSPMHTPHHASLRFIQNHPVWLRLECGTLPAMCAWRKQPAECLQPFTRLHLLLLLLLLILLMLLQYLYSSYLTPQ